MTTAASPRVLIVACGALARELRDIIGANSLEGVTLECLPAHLHNRPEHIPDAVRARVRAAKGEFDRILVGYADCGTGGRLDQVCREEEVERLPGVHCFELYAGRDAFADFHDDEIGTLYLTDYMVRHFERLIMEGLGINDHPELRDAYFGNYTRAIHLAQTGDPDLAERGRQAAARLGLRHEYVHTGYAELGEQIVEFHRRRPAVGADK